MRQIYHGSIPIALERTNIFSQKHASFIYLFICLFVGDAIGMIVIGSVDCMQ